MKGLYIYMASMFLILGKANAQESTLSLSGLIEYQKGSLPIVIAVAHGGASIPDSIPDRNCNNFVANHGEHTIEAAYAMSQQLKKLTGCYPFLVINHLHSNKIDCNLNKTLGTCLEPKSEQVWQEYHDFLSEALSEAGEANLGNKFLIDLHGHDHETQRIEIGYLISGVTMQATNATIDIDDPIHLTSIENLIQYNIHQLSRSQLLRGALSFGSLLEDQHFASVPSQSRPFPINSSEYKSGGFTTQTYSNPTQDADVISMQMGLNYLGLRDSPENIEAFGAAFAKSINTFILLHRDLEIANCGENAIFQPPPDELLAKDLVLYPNLALTSQEQLTIAGKEVLQKEYSIHDLTGRVLSSGIVENYRVSLPRSLNSGMYVFALRDEEGAVLYTRKFVLVE